MISASHVDHSRYFSLSRKLLLLHLAGIVWLLMPCVVARISPSLLFFFSLIVASLLFMSYARLMCLIRLSLLFLFVVSLFPFPSLYFSLLGECPVVYRKAARIKEAK